MYFGVGGAPVSRVRILLADDNAAVLELVATLLSKDHDVVSTVADGRKVVKECLRLKPDVVVLDISFGKVNGIDLARQLREAGSNSKIIFLTVHEDYDYLKAAIGAGAMAYVVKPYLSADLPSAVKAVLADKFFASSSLMYQEEEPH
jgi:DNA-binding NarL/FixJ family response regulator